jgi:hypothetical protein
MEDLQVRITKDLGVIDKASPHGLPPLMSKEGIKGNCDNAIILGTSTTLLPRPTTLIYT